MTLCLVLKPALVGFGTVSLSFHWDWYRFRPYLSGIAKLKITLKRVPKTKRERWNLEQLKKRSDSEWLGHDKAYFIHYSTRAQQYLRWTTVGHLRHKPKSGGCCATFRRGAGFPSNTSSHGLRFTSVPSGIFIHPTVWPQYTWAEKWKPWITTEMIEMMYS